MYILEKGSAPGWEQSFDDLASLARAFEACVCASCRQTRQQIEDRVLREHGVPLALLDETQCDADTLTSLEFDIERAFPDDYLKRAPRDQVRALASTDCGCEYEVFWRADPAPGSWLFLVTRPFSEPDEADDFDSISVTYGIFDTREKAQAYCQALGLDPELAIEEHALNTGRLR